MCNKEDTGCLQTLYISHFLTDVDMSWTETCDTCLGGSQSRPGTKRVLKQQRHYGMDDVNLVSSARLNNEAITFNGRTPSFHLMPLIITTKYTATAAVYSVFTLGTFIILKLSVFLSLGFVFIHQRFSQRPEAEISALEHQFHLDIGWRVGKHEPNDKYVKC